jgi:hypothetical protein
VSPPSSSIPDLAQSPPSSVETLHTAYVLVGNAIGLVARAARLTIGGDSPKPLVYEADRYLEQADSLLQDPPASLEDTPPLDQLRADVRALVDLPPSRRARRDGFAEMLGRLRAVRRAIGAALYRDEEMRRSPPRTSRLPGARTTLTNLLKQAPGGRRHARWWVAAGVLTAVWALFSFGQCAGH